MRMPDQADCKSGAGYRPPPRTISKGGNMNNTGTVLAALAIAGIAAMGADKPLVLASQGSFFVGGESKALTAAPNAPPPGDVTINQMYVQYQTPPGGDRHVPVVMVHGCCLSSKTWETTPDGRMGWNEYFVRKGRPTYLADQVSRGRSGFDASRLTA